MKLTLQNSFVYAIATLIALTSVYLLVIYPNYAHATAGELPATVATTSEPTVGTTASLVFATSTCGARVITTYASPIMLTFSDNQGSVPSGSFGFLQAASTTITYGNGSFGCGAYRVYSYIAGPITVMESR